MSQRSILVTSAQEGEGKSLTLNALARALAALDKKVLVIDGDMRRPVQHALFRVAPGRDATGPCRKEEAPPTSM